MNSEVDVTAVVGWVGLFSFLSIWVLAVYGSHAFRSWQDNHLKRDMIARGYTAREVVAVIRCKRAKGQTDESLPDVPPAKPIKQPTFAAR
ncbi:MAG: hypothetical protein WD872_15545 [Pirellulaceae bacterium]